MAVHIVLEEIGKPYELELVSSRGHLGGVGTTNPEWMAKNPKGRIPALSGVTGRIGGADDLLTEAHAILFYLARRHPDAGLLPADAAGEARAIEWMNWLSSNVHAMSYGQIWRPNRFVADERDYAAVQGKGQQNVREQYAYIESLVSDGRDWALPGAYSVVDPYLLVFYGWGARVGLDMSASYPAWHRLAQRVLQRPAVQRVLAKENISIA
ncbi:glutathione S-transferase family protein [Bradyrhizobium sp. STM 3557]|uniref:glutathione S-transferase family protein n=1 Tax=Bradyrhizobium sp. STM 3557 TaxID=578920 RepID=UPI00388E9908